MQGWLLSFVDEMLLPVAMAVAVVISSGCTLYAFLGALVPRPFTVKRPVLLPASAD